MNAQLEKYLHKVQKLCSLISCNEKKLYLFFMVLASLGLLCVLFFQYQFPFVKLDDAQYLPKYIHKFKEEGRWLNYLIFDELLGTSIYFIPVFLVQLINLVLYSVFSYYVFKQVTSSLPAYALTLLSCFFYPFIAMQYYPVTLFPSCLVLVVSLVFSSLLLLPIFFVVFGILANGVLSHFYFLLPLLFINKSHISITRLIIYWVVGFAIGYIFAQCMTYWLTGDWIRLASWRAAKPATNLSELIANIRLTINGFNVFFLYNYKIVYVFTLFCATVLTLVNYLSKPTCDFKIFLLAMIRKYGYLFIFLFVIGNRLSFLSICIVFSLVLLQFALNRYRWQFLLLCVMFSVVGLYISIGTEFPPRAAFSIVFALFVWLAISAYPEQLILTLYLSFAVFFTNIFIDMKNYYHASNVVTQDLLPAVNEAKGIHKVIILEKRRGWYEYLNKKYNITGIESTSSIFNNLFRPLGFDQIIWLHFLDYQIVHSLEIPQLPFDVSDEALAQLSFKRAGAYEYAVKDSWLLLRLAK